MAKAAEKVKQTVQMERRYEWRELTDDGLLKKPQDTGPYYDTDNVNHYGGYQTEEQAIAGLKAYADRTRWGSTDDMVLVAIYSTRRPDWRFHRCIPTAGHTEQRAEKMTKPLFVRADDGGREMNAPAQVVLPYPQDGTLSQRMKNLSVLFGMMNSFAAEGSFKALAKEVEEMEQERAMLLDALKPFASFIFGPKWVGHGLVQREGDTIVLCGYDDAGNVTGANVNYSDFLKAQKAVKRATGCKWNVGHTDVSQAKWTKAVMVKFWEAVLYVTGWVIFSVILKKFESDRSWDFLGNIF
jgi:hypothetical protein